MRIHHRERRSVALSHRLSLAADDLGQPAGRYGRIVHWKRNAPIARGEWEIRHEPCRRFHPTEQLVLTVDRCEQLGVAGDVFRGAEKEHATQPEREVEQGQDSVLQVRVQVNKQVAAGEDVDA